MLPWILQELNICVRKTFGCGKGGGHLIWALNERSVSDGGNLCPLCLVILKSVWHRRHLTAAIQLAMSCSELYFARCCTLKRTGTSALESNVCVCVWFSLAQLPTEIAWVSFRSHFLRKKQLFLTSLCFSYLFNGSTRLFLYLFFSQSRKILS